MDNGAKKDTNQISNALLGMMIFNAVNSAYIVNYRPKTGTYHIWLCSALGVLMVVFSVWVIIMCIRMLKGKKGKKGYNITLLILAIALLIIGADSALPYCKDLIAGSKTVTTDKYLIVKDDLHFLDDNGNEVKMQIPDDTAKLFLSKENYEYDSENNLLHYYDSITVTYFPNSKTIVSTFPED